MFLIMSVRNINREAILLIISILFPIILVGFIALYISGHDFILFLLKIDVIYYILIVPFGLGAIVAVLWYRKPRN